MVGNSVFWTPQKEIELINLYYEYSLLWDTNNPEHNKKDAREEAYLQVCKFLGQDVNGYCFKVSDIKEKFKNLRTMFQREHKKVLSSAENGSGYTSRWNHFHRLTFLRNSQRPGKNMDSMSPIISVKYEMVAGDSSDVGQQLDCEENSSCSVAEESPAEDLPQPRKRRRVAKQGLVGRCLDLLRAERVAQDAEESFGRHLAANLRKLPHLARERAKLDMQAVLLRAVEGNQGAN